MYKVKYTYSILNIKVMLQVYQLLARGWDFAPRVCNILYFLQIMIISGFLCSKTQNLKQCWHDNLDAQRRHH